jgi:hypothetical protein
VHSRELSQDQERFHAQLLDGLADTEPGS